MANEKRLIDANAMREDWLENGENEYVYDTNAVLDSIDAQPTVAAVEVVHGRWIWSEENECDVCSNCGMASLNNYRGNPVPSAYCPNCGADMRERSEGDAYGEVRISTAEVADHRIANGVTIPVRCGDCVHCFVRYSENEAYCGHPGGLNDCLRPDDFCSYGERRTDV